MCASHPLPYFGTAGSDNHRIDQVSAMALQPPACLPGEAAFLGHDIRREHAGSASSTSLGGESSRNGSPVAAPVRSEFSLWSHVGVKARGITTSNGQWSGALAGEALSFNRPRTSSPCKRRDEGDWLVQDVLLNASSVNRVHEGCDALLAATNAFVGKFRAIQASPSPSISPRSLATAPRPVGEREPSVVQHSSLRGGAGAAAAIDAEADLFCQTPGGRLWYLLPSVGLVAVTSNSPALCGRKIGEVKQSLSGPSSTASGASSAASPLDARTRDVNSPVEAKTARHRVSTVAVVRPTVSPSWTERSSVAVTAGAQSCSSAHQPRDALPKLEEEGAATQCSPVTVPIGGHASVSEANPLTSSEPRELKSTGEVDTSCVTSGRLTSATTPQCDILQNCGQSTPAADLWQDHHADVAVIAAADPVMQDCRCAFAVLRALVTVRVSDQPPQSVTEWCRKILTDSPDLAVVRAAGEPAQPISTKGSATSKTKAGTLQQHTLRHACQALAFAKQQLLSCAVHSKLGNSEPTSTTDRSKTALACSVEDVGFMTPFGDRFRIFDHSHVRNSLFGKVFSAVDRVTGKRVAVKLSSAVHVQERISLSGTCVLENPFHEINIMKQYVCSCVSHSAGL